MRSSSPPRRSVPVPVPVAADGAPSCPSPALSPCVASAPLDRQCPRAIATGDTDTARDATAAATSTSVLTLPSLASSTPIAALAHPLSIAPVVHTDAVTLSLMPPQSAPASLSTSESSVSPAPAAAVPASPCPPLASASPACTAASRCASGAPRPSAPSPTSSSSAAARAQLVSSAAQRAPSLLHRGSRRAAASKTAKRSAARMGRIDEDEDETKEAVEPGHDGTSSPRSSTRATSASSSSSMHATIIQSDEKKESTRFDIDSVSTSSTMSTSSSSSSSSSLNGDVDLRRRDGCVGQYCTLNSQYDLCFTSASACVSSVVPLPSAGLDILPLTRRRSDPSQRSSSASSRCWMVSCASVAACWPGASRSVRCAASSPRLVDLDAAERAAVAASVRATIGADVTNADADAIAHVVAEWQDKMRVRAFVHEGHLVRYTPFGIILEDLLAYADWRGCVIELISHMKALISRLSLPDQHCAISMWLACVRVRTNLTLSSYGSPSSRLHLASYPMMALVLEVLQCVVHHGCGPPLRRLSKCPAMPPPSAYSTADRVLRCGLSQGAFDRLWRMGDAFYADLRVLLGEGVVGAAVWSAKATLQRIGKWMYNTDWIMKCPYTHRCIAYDYFAMVPTVPPLFSVAVCDSLLSASLDCSAVGSSSTSASSSKPPRRGLHIPRFRRVVAAGPHHRAVGVPLSEWTPALNAWDGLVPLRCSGRPITLAEAQCAADAGTSAHSAGEGDEAEGAQGAGMGDRAASSNDIYRETNDNARPVMIRRPTRKYMSRTSFTNRASAPVDVEAVGNRIADKLNSENGASAATVVSTMCTYASDLTSFTEEVMMGTDGRAERVSTCDDLGVDICGHYRVVRDSSLVAVAFVSSSARPATLLRCMSADVFRSLPRADQQLVRSSTRRESERSRPPIAPFEDVLKPCAAAAMSEALQDLLGHMSLAQLTLLLHPSARSADVRSLTPAQRSRRALEADAEAEMVDVKRGEDAGVDVQAKTAHRLEDMMSSPDVTEAKFKAAYNDWREDRRTTPSRFEHLNTMLMAAAADVFYDHPDATYGKFRYLLRVLYETECRTGVRSASLHRFDEFDHDVLFDCGMLGRFVAPDRLSFHLMSFGDADRWQFHRYLRLFTRHSTPADIRVVLDTIIGTAEGWERRGFVAELIASSVRIDELMHMTPVAESKLSTGGDNGTDAAAAASSSSPIDRPVTYELRSTADRDGLTMEYVMSIIAHYGMKWGWIHEPDQYRAVRFHMSSLLSRFVHFYAAPRRWLDSPYSSLQSTVPPCHIDVASVLQSMLGGYTLLSHCAMFKVGRYLDRAADLMSPADGFMLQPRLMRRPPPQRCDPLGGTPSARHPGAAASGGDGRIVALDFASTTLECLGLPMPVDARAYRSFDGRRLRASPVVSTVTTRQYTDTQREFERHFSSGAHCQRGRRRRSRRRASNFDRLPSHLTVEGGPDDRPESPSSTQINDRSSSSAGDEDEHADGARSSDAETMMYPFNQLSHGATNAMHFLNMTSVAGIHNDSIRCDNRNSIDQCLRVNGIIAAELRFLATIPVSVHDYASRHPMTHRTILTQLVELGAVEFAHRCLSFIVGAKFVDDSKGRTSDAQVDIIFGLNHVDRIGMTFLDVYLWYMHRACDAHVDPSLCVQYVRGDFALAGSSPLTLHQRFSDFCDTHITVQLSAATRSEAAACALCRAHSPAVVRGDDRGALPCVVEYMQRMDTPAPAPTKRKSIATQAAAREAASTDRIPTSTVHCSSSVEQSDVSFGSRVSISATAIDLPIAPADLASVGSSASHPLSISPSSPMSLIANVPVPYNRLNPRLPLCPRDAFVSFHHCVVASSLLRDGLVTSRLADPPTDPQPQRLSMRDRLVWVIEYALRQDAVLRLSQFDDVLHLVWNMCGVFLSRFQINARGSSFPASMRDLVKNSLALTRYERHAGRGAQGSALQLRKKGFGFAGSARPIMKGAADEFAKLPRTVTTAQDAAMLRLVEQQCETRDGQTASELIAAVFDERIAHRVGSDCALPILVSRLNDIVTSLYSLVLTSMVKLVDVVPASVAMDHVTAATRMSHSHHGKTAVSSSHASRKRIRDAPASSSAAAAASASASAPSAVVSVGASTVVAASSSSSHDVADRDEQPPSYGDVATNRGAAHRMSDVGATESPPPSVVQHRGSASASNSSMHSDGRHAPKLAIDLDALRLARTAAASIHTDYTDALRRATVKSTDSIDLVRDGMNNNGDGDDDDDDDDGDSAVRSTGASATPRLILLINDIGIHISNGCDRPYQLHMKKYNASAISGSSVCLAFLRRLAYRRPRLGAAQVALIGCVLRFNEVTLLTYLDSSAQRDRRADSPRATLAGFDAFMHEPAMQRAMKLERAQSQLMDALVSTHTPRWDAASIHALLAKHSHLRLMSDVTALLRRTRPQAHSESEAGSAAADSGTDSGADSGVDSGDDAEQDAGKDADEDADEDAGEDARRGAGRGDACDAEEGEDGSSEDESESDDSFIDPRADSEVEEEGAMNRAAERDNDDAMMDDDGSGATSSPDFDPTSIDQDSSMGVNSSLAAHQSDSDSAASDESGRRSAVALSSSSSTSSPPLPAVSARSVRRVDSRSSSPTRQESVAGSPAPLASPRRRRRRHHRRPRRDRESASASRSPEIVARRGAEQGEETKQNDAENENDDRHEKKSKL